jgi:superfamily II DNA/RNA helicase
LVDVFVSTVLSNKTPPLKGMARALSYRRSEGARLSVNMNEEFQMNETATDVAITESFDAVAHAEPAQAATETVANDAIAEAADNTDGSDLQAPDAEEAVAEVQEVVPAGPSDFEIMGLSQALVQATKDMGFTKATSVQLKAIPLALQTGGDKKYVDLMVSSQTGSGKTAAFLLPVLHTLEADMFAKAQAEKDELEAEVQAAIARGETPPKKPKRKDPTNNRNFKAPTPGALILCPTRELAQQVANDAIDLVRHMRGVRVASVIGGMPYQLQIAKLQNANLIVATPGRLLDLQRSSQIKLQEVKFLVVDEADRMLDLGFSDDLAEVNNLTAQRQQTMMFSATFASRIQQLAARVMREPQRITIDTPQEKHNNIKQILFWADNMQHKRKLLDHWMRDETIEQAIVFVSTQVECDGLANDLADSGFAAAALHGALSQGMRNRRLNMLREGRIQFLIATDVAARGIDVPSISHVFNYGLPMKAEDYTHRIGRTGRAGRSGTAVTIAEFRDRRKIGDIEFFTKQPIKSEVIPGLEPTVRERPARAGFGPRGNDRGGDRGGDRSADRSGGDRFADRGGDRGERSYGPRPGGFNDRNKGGGFGGGGGFGDRTKNVNEGGWGGRPQQGDSRGDQRSFEPRDDARGFQPRGGDQAADNRGGDRDNRGFAPRAPFGGERGGDRGFQDRRPQERGQERSFEPRGDQRAAPRFDARNDNPFQREDRPVRKDRPAYEPKNFDVPVSKRPSTFANRPFDDKKPGKKPFSPGKTGASSFAKTGKPKVVKVIGRKD